MYIFLHFEAIKNDKIVNHPILVRNDFRVGFDRHYFIAELTVIPRSLDNSEFPKSVEIIEKVLKSPFRFLQYALRGNRGGFATITQILGPDGG